jgi:hypothetical protein
MDVHMNRRAREFLTFTSSRLWNLWPAAASPETANGVPLDFVFGFDWCRRLFGWLPHDPEIPYSNVYA